MALAVNDSGVIVGYSLSPDGRSECQARDIDNAGRIVGGCVTTAGQYKAVAWVDGALTRLIPGWFQYGRGNLGGGCSRNLQRAWFRSLRHAAGLLVAARQARPDDRGDAGRQRRRHQ